MVSDNSGKYIDMAVALAHVDGDLQFLAELAVIFLQDYPLLVNEARGSIAKNDYAGLERAAHTLKGRLAFFGIASIREQASALEAMGREKNLTGAGEALADIERELQSLLPEIESLVGPGL